MAGWGAARIRRDDGPLAGCIDVQPNDLQPEAIGIDVGHVAIAATTWRRREFRLAAGAQQRAPGCRTAIGGGRRTVAAEVGGVGDWPRPRRIQPAGGLETL